MKTANQILTKLTEIKKQQKHFEEKLFFFKFTDIELIEGSLRYGSLQEKEAKCQGKIELLQWALELEENIEAIKQPKKEDYGFHTQNGFDDEPSGWSLEGGEDAYYKALKKYELIGNTEQFKTN